MSPASGGCSHVGSLCLTPTMLVINFHCIQTLFSFFSFLIIAINSVAVMESFLDCSTLADSFPGKVHIPGSPGYEANQFSYFAAFENEVTPACFIQPETAEDVAAIIKYAQLAFMTGKRAQFAIRSGGHTAWAGSANIQGGITIDLSKLKANTVVVDDEKKLATIGAGARWGDVYEVLALQGLGVVGGRVANVGAGGLSLGGELN